MNNSLYDNDLYAWSLEQSNLMRIKDYESLDIENIIEEIEGVGRCEQKTLISYLKNALLHMLKIKYQPLLRSRSWDNSVAFSIRQAQEVLEDNPSLKSKLQKSLERSYFRARYEASKQTGLELESFPQECPWTMEQILEKN
jgi:hypothetical protein